MLECLETYIHLTSFLRKLQTLFFKLAVYIRVKEREMFDYKEF